MATKNQNYFNRLYHDLMVNSPRTFSMDVSSVSGEGHISQIMTRHDILLSDWQMRYKSDTDMEVRGPVSRKYIEIIFCLKDGVSWEISKKHGGSSMVTLHSHESCIYAGHGGTECICYKKDSDFLFKSIKIPVIYFTQILSDYFDGRKSIAYEEKILNGISKVPVIPSVERLLAETGQFSQYHGGYGHLYLNGKLLELLSVYLETVLESDIFSRKNLLLSRTERAAVMEAKRIIDSRLAFAPSCEELAQAVHLSVSKLRRSFSAICGMPIHQYVIEQRLVQAADLLVSGKWNVTEVAAIVGYGKASNFAAAFRKKYGAAPTDYVRLMENRPK